MRTCAVCKKKLPEKEFWRVRKTDTELQKACKACMTQASKKWASKNLRRKREHNRLMSRIKRAQSGGRTAEERQRDSARSLEYYYDHKSEYRARDSVREAIKRGQKLLTGTLGRHCRQGRVLFPPTRCDVCGSETRLYPHHYLGYDRQHWLDVQFVCQPCHNAIHVEINWVKATEPDCANPYLEGFRRYCRERIQQTIAQAKGNGHD